MTSTTIKLESATRDRLRAQARAAHRTLGEHIKHLIEAEDRRLRMDELAAAIAATPADALADYVAETGTRSQAIGSESDSHRLLGRLSQGGHDVGHSRADYDGGPALAEPHRTG